MKFKANADELTAAIDRVSVVTPKALTAKDGPVYLFYVRGDRCFVYSRDQYRVARSSFPVTDVEGEGAFVYPASFTQSFKFIGDSITFETVDGPEEWSVRYSATSGASGERTSFDPRVISPCDRDFDNATSEAKFPAALLREAISMGRTFLPKPNETTAEEHFKTLQVFDKSRPEWAKGDGYMFCSDSKSAYFFYCQAFEGKHLEVHADHLPHLVNFLSKCEGDASFRRGANYTFIEDGVGTVLGWTHHSKTHGKFSHYGTAKENFVFHIEKTVLQKALRYTRTELDAKQDRIKMHFDHTNETIQFGVSVGNAKATSFPVVVSVKQKLEHDFDVNVNINRLMDIIDGVKGNVVVLRLLVGTLDKDGTVVFKDDGKPQPALIRTMDEFRLDATGAVSLDPEKSFLCRVTRFTPSK